MLKIENLNVAYGNITALRDLSINVEEHSCVALVGANGAGKTTLMHTIAGVKSPKSGKIIYRGEDATKWMADRMVAEGVALVPEGRQIFSQLTVEENLMMGAFSRKDDYQAELENAYNMFPRLRERKSQKGGNMSGGEQQMLALARALMSKPKLLLLDEPSMGLAPVIVSDIFRIIRKINEDGVTVVLVEQNAKMALKIAQKCYVIENGSVVLEGTSEQLRNDQRIREIYLGG
ncbi:MAG: ABC transporter ATP-binding protein [Lachnospiraceae bacterium]|nr:ABC transporter ATP-binding protein [Lachnospiraceae bacterium]